MFDIVKKRDYNKNTFTQNNKEEIVNARVLEFINQII